MARACAAGVTGVPVPSVNHQVVRNIRRREGRWALLLAGLQRWPVDVVVSIISRAAPTVCAVTARTCAPSALTRDDHKIRRNGKDLGGESRVRRSLCACGFGAPPQGNCRGDDR